MRRQLTIRARMILAFIPILATACVFSGHNSWQSAPETPAPDSDPETVWTEDVFEGDAMRVLILLGQSNMAGFARGDEFPAEMAAPSEKRLILTYEGWAPLVPGDRNGPEISLAYELSQMWPEETFGIIKVAVGGTGIRAFIPDWSEELADITGDGHKGSLYAQIEYRIEQAQALGDTQFIGVVWKQGGSDAWNETTAEGYLDYLAAIIEALREDTNTPTLPLFISTYFDAEDLLLEFDSLGTMARSLDALFDILMDHNLAQDVIAYTVTVPTGMLPLTLDGIHFNTEGQILHGEILAEAIWAYYELGMWRTP